uniref:Uncharacterized protein n=1 Tax=Amphimedon queenslandica TaxID=400682 RepID=A0A1X7THQ3_AMPQE
MSAEEIAKLLNTGFYSSNSARRILLLPYAEPSGDGEDECDGLLVTTPEQLHFTSQQELSQHLEQQEEEYDDEEPLITHATSNTIVVEPEDLELDETAVDLREREEIEALYSSGCCAKKCHTQFEKDDLMRVHWDLYELTKDQLEMTILGHLMSSTSCETVERNRTEYEYRGKKICKKLFLFVYSIRNGTYKNLRRHFLQNGIKPRVHGNTGCIPCHALSVEGV